MSSEINEHVVVMTTENSTGIPRAGFGTMGILSCNATFPERSREYSNLSGAVEDGFGPKTPEYRAIQAALAQRPRPRTVKILRAEGKPTMRYEISVVEVLDEVAYTLRIEGSESDIEDTTCTYTSDASATNDEIVNGLLALVNAIANKNFTASTTGSAGSLSLVITGDAPGVWFSVEVDSLSRLSVEVTHAEPAIAIATDLDEIINEDSDWYALKTLYNSDACVKATAAAIESRGKLYVVQLSDSTVATAVDGGGDTASDLKALNYARTAAVYHGNPAAMIDAAWMGRVLPTLPGKATWKWKTLRGVEASSLTTTQRSRLRAKNCNAYTIVGVRGQMWEGKTADGDFIDVTRNIDWQDDDLQKSVAEALQNNDIIPMTPEGVAVIQGEIEGSLQRGVDRGIWRGGDNAPTVAVPDVDDISENDRGERLLPDISWEGQLAGAVHKVNVSGNVRV